MILLIDNYDSFTYNLAHLFGELGAEVTVIRNDAIDADEAERLEPSHLIVSPGPGRVSTRSTRAPTDREHAHVRLPPAESDVIGLCRTNPRGSPLLPPPPASDLRHIVPVSADVVLVVDELVTDRLLRVGGARPELRYSVDDVADQVEAVEIIEHAHIEGGRRGDDQLSPRRARLPAPG